MIFLFFFFLHYIKIDKTTYQKNGETVLKRANDYYENNKRSIKRKCKK